jgi:hypothetical protein
VQPDPVEIAEPDVERARWLEHIKDYDDWSRAWATRARKIVKRYRDDRPEQYTDRRFNIFWSNVEVLKPATLARKPKPVVERRFRDQDQVGRVAAEILERAVSFTGDNEAFMEVLKAGRDDFLIVGRGSAWVRYVPHFRQMPPQPGTEETQDDGVSITNDAAEHTAAEGEAYAPEPVEQLAFEEVCFDYVAWNDFGFTPARRWDEVRAVWRRVQMTRQELCERFGDEIGKAVNLDAKPDVGLAAQDTARMREEMHSRANVYEIWDRTRREVVWVCKGYEPGLLDKRPDPLRLSGFFPCPRPAFATLSTDSLIPIPDFVYYQDQADELDDIIQRLTALTRAARVVGLYDASQQGSIARMFQEGGDNSMIPVETWAAFAAAGGIKGVIDFMPLDQIVAAIAQLQERAEAVKAQVYEITGIADIVRGYSAPSETATAQQIKGQFAALRLQDRQAEVARFARDLLSIAAEIIAEHFSPETIALMVGAQEQPPEFQQAFAPAVELLRNDALRNFRVEIETDSTVSVDENTEKQQATELLAAMGAFLKDVAPVAQMAPQLLPLLGQMLLYGVRHYRGGRNLEGAVEQAFQSLEQTAQQAAEQQAQMAQQGPPPDPAVMKAQAEIEMGKQRLDADLTEKAARLQMDAQQMAFKAEQDRAAMAEKARAGAQPAVSIALGDDMQRSLGEGQMASVAALQQVAAGIGDAVAAMSQAAQAMAQSGAQVAQMGGAVTEAARMMAAPVQIVRGPDGRVAGAVRGA